MLAAIVARLAEVRHGGWRFRSTGTIGGRAGMDYRVHGKSEIGGGASGSGTAGLQEF